MALGACAGTESAANIPKYGAWNSMKLLDYFLWSNKGTNETLNCARFTLKDCQNNIICKVDGITAKLLWCFQ